MVPPRSKGNGNRSRTHGGDALSGGSGGDRSRHGGDIGCGCRSRHDDGSSGCRNGAVGRGRRRLSHSGPKDVSFMCLHHGWVGEGEEMERMGGGKVSEVIWNEMREGRWGGLNRWLRATKELSPINIHKYTWLMVVAQKIWKN